VVAANVWSRMGLHW